jgi:2'-5' RNA ligase
MKTNYLRGAYCRVWESFLHADSTKDGRHDTLYWHSHDGPYAACVVRVPADSLQPGLAELRRAIAPLPGVRLHPDHFVHVMLQELGFVVDQPARPDEISSARLEEFVLAAVDPISSSARLSLTLGGANAFEDAVFLEVAPGEPLLQLHDRLFDLAAVPQVPRFPYLPHCTIAHFDGTCPPSSAQAALQPWREHVFGACLVSEVEIVTLDPKQTYPELESYAVIPLGE